MNLRFRDATRALVGRFRRQRPLRSGSLIITILGDAIAPRGGALTLGSLIRLARPFGLTERLVRTSVARVAHDGWLLSRRAGRNSEYRLSDLGTRRFAEATHRIYSAGPDVWSGRWSLLLTAAARDAPRERMRQELQWLGFGQLGTNVFAHPGRTAAAVERLASELGASNAITVEARSGTLEADRRIVRIGWDFAHLNRSYARFIAGFAAIDSACRERARPSETPEDAAEPFVVRTLLIHEYRKIHLRDPLLPQSLLPAGWIGRDAYELCRRLYQHVFAAAEAFISAHAETLDGGLPPANEEAYARFGGIDS
jgi:phenylacetic acid degradation operon negative regulatory protein